MAQSDSPALAPEASAAPSLATEELRRRAALAKQVSSSFGDIVTLLMRSESERGRSLGDLEWMVIPALQAGQFAVAEAQAKDTGVVAPVGAVLWAMVSESVDQRLSANPDQPLKLDPADWRSGQIPWIIAAFGEAKVVGGLLQQLAKTVFTAQPAKLRARGEDGRPCIARLEFTGQPPSG
jgi:hemolysin-activating ACP:hemolysin acyltransferase